MSALRSICTDVSSGPVAIMRNSLWSVAIARAASRSTSGASRSVSTTGCDDLAVNPIIDCTLLFASAMEEMGAVPWGRGTGEGIGLSGHKNEYKAGVRKICR